MLLLLLFTNAKIIEVKNEVPSFNNLSTTAALTTGKNEIHNVSKLVKKVDYDAETRDIKNEYFTTSDYNKLANNILGESYIIGQSYFVSDGEQLYFTFKPLYYTLERLGDTEKVVSWKYKGFLDKKITTLTNNDNSLSTLIKW